MLFKIGVVAKKLGLTEKRIREYEKEGLINPIRKKPGMHRVFSSFEIKQIKRIKHLIHDRGLTINGIKHLLVMAPCWVVLKCNNPKICPAYQNPHKPCWKIKQDLETDFPCMGTCEQCAVFLSRNFESQYLFNKP